MSKTIYVAPYTIAVIHAGLGDEEAALAALEMAFEKRCCVLAKSFNTDERLASRTSSPR